MTLFLAMSAMAQPYSEVAKLTASDRAEGDRLGYAVSIYGNWAAAGAYGDDFSTLDPNMGSVYMYEQQGLNNWVQTQKLFNSDQDDYDRFGWSIDIHGDFMIVGAYGEDHDTTNSNSLSKAGAAYIFQNINGTWTEMQKLVASDRDADDEFGWSVSIYDSTAVVGAHIEDHDENGNNFMYHAGSVYVFELGTNGVWAETQKIVAADRWVDMYYPNGYSGEDLADQFGGTVALWGDYLVVGAHHHDYATTNPNSGALWSSGAVYIFERTTGVWNQVAKIQNSDRESWDRFGYDVAIDSNIIAVCAYSEDEDETGNNALTNPGSVYIFERNLGGSWNEIQKIVPNDRSSGDHFGFSLDLDDTLMVIGCESDDDDEFDSDVKPDAGSAYIFASNGGVWSQFQKLDASDRQQGDNLGVAVAISGSSAIVGAQYQDYDTTLVDSIDEAGAAYMYNNLICTPQTTNITATICGGDTYTVGSSTYNSTGVYTDILFDIYGCDSTIITDLTVENDIVTHLYDTMCYGGTVYIHGVPVSTPGNYSDHFTAQNGCDSTVITHLTENPQITSEQYVSICWGESYSIGLSTYTQTGTYEDVVSASNFCDSTIVTHLTVELPLDVSIAQNKSILTSNEDNATYQWFDCDNGQEIPGATFQSYNAPVIGNYGVIVTKNGCTDTSACLHVSELTAGLSEDNLNDLISIYPNPSNGEFTISVPTLVAMVEIEIFDPRGRLVLKKQLNATQSTLSLEKGVYIIRIKSSEGEIKKRLVIQ